MELSTIPAFIQQSYGISYDNKDLMGLLDEEAPVIAQEEDEIADEAAEAEMNGIVEADLIIEPEEDLVDLDKEDSDADEGG